MTNSVQQSDPELLLFSPAAIKRLRRDPAKLTFEEKKRSVKGNK